MLLGNAVPKICKHIALGARQPSRHFQDLIHCAFDHLEGKTRPDECLFCNGTASCHSCETDYTLEGKDLGRDEHGERRVAIVVTKWIGFRVRSPDSYPRWKDIGIYNYLPGFARVRFEEEKEVGPDQLTLENKNKVLSFFASQVDGKGSQGQVIQKDQERSQKDGKENKKISQTYYLDQSSSWVRDEFIPKPKVETIEEKAER